MPRRKVIAEKRKWRCPICHKQSGKARGLAMHLAMKGGEEHAEWRAKHNLPTNYETMKDVQKIIPHIVEIIQKKPEKYSW